MRKDRIQPYPQERPLVILYCGLHTLHIPQDYSQEKTSGYSWFIGKNVSLRTRIHTQ